MVGFDEEVVSAMTRQCKHRLDQPPVQVDIYSSVC